MFGVLRVIVRHMTNNEPVVDPEPVEPPPDPLAPDADAPFGYMIDPESGERRAKKRPGRQRTQPAATGPATAGTPSLDELKDRQAPVQHDEDRSPDTPPRPRGKRARARERARKPTPPTPPFRAGPIA